MSPIENPFSPGAKTVLLDRMRDEAEASGVHTVRIEAPEERSLPALLAPHAPSCPKQDRSMGKSELIFLPASA